MKDKNGACQSREGASKCVDKPVKSCNIGAAEEQSNSRIIIQYVTPLCVKEECMVCPAVIYKLKSVCGSSCCHKYDSSIQHVTLHHIILNHIMSQQCISCPTQREVHGIRSFEFVHVPLRHYMRPSCLCHHHLRSPGKQGGGRYHEKRGEECW